MKKSEIWFVIIVTLFSLCYYVINRYERGQALKDAALVVATITDIKATKSSFLIEVQYKYKGQIMHSELSTYEPDSLKTNEQIVLSISKRFPERYVEYIRALK